MDEELVNPSKADIARAELEIRTVFERRLAKFLTVLKAPTTKYKDEDLDLWDWAMEFDEEYTY